MKCLASVIGCGVMIMALSGCDNGGGMSIEELVTEEGLSNPFAFRDFRLGMTRGEVYHILNGVRLSLPEEPKDASYQQWGSEVTASSLPDVTPVQPWSGLPNNPYAAVYAFGMSFDDGHGLVPDSDEEIKNVSINANMLSEEEKRARLLLMYFAFICEEGVSSSIIQACERRFAGLDSMQMDKLGALVFGWRQPNVSRGRKQLAGLFVREGDPSGFLAILEIVDMEYYMRK